MAGSARRAAWLLAAGALLACATAGPRGAGRIFAWEVEPAPGGGHACLLGSVHLGRTDLSFDPAVESAFEEADAVVVEIDLRQVSLEKSTALLIERGRLPEGQVLADVVSAYTWDEFVALLERHGQDAESYRTFEPWVAMIVVSALLASERELSGESGVDRYFLERVRPDQEVISLETLEYQLSLFDEVPLDQQVAMLSAVLAEVEGSADTIDLLYQAWLRGDTAAVQQIAFLDETADPTLAGLQERIFTRRNAAMAERIDALLDEERSYFVVVGAGHLVGEEGIPSLLEARGHHVEQLERSAP